jgi:hypothetical protein
VARRPVPLVAVPLLALGLTACGGTFAADEVATKAEEVLEQQVGARPDVSCPDDLDAEVGAETRCTASVDGVTVGATVTVTSVDDDGAEFDVQVDEEPVGGGQ